MEENTAAVKIPTWKERVRATGLPNDRWNWRAVQGAHRAEIADLRALLASHPAPQAAADGVGKPFAFFVQPSGFGPFIECEPTQAGCFPAYRAATERPAIPAQGQSDEYLLDICRQQTNPLAVAKYGDSFLRIAQAVWRAAQEQAASCPAPDAEAIRSAARYDWLRVQPFEVWKKISWNTWPGPEDADWIAAGRDIEIDTLRAMSQPSPAVKSAEPDYRDLYEKCKREKAAAYERLSKYEHVKMVKSAEPTGGAA